MLVLPVAAAGQTRADGAKRIPITGAPGSLQNPCISPQSDRLAFTVWHRGYNRAPASVFTVPLAGGAATRVSPDDTHASVNLPGSCWGPAGEIVYASDPGDGEQIFVHPPGGERRALTPERLIGYEPSFSPDGRFVVFEAHPNDRERGELYVVGADGSGLRRLTLGRDDRQPNWSPRGERIVFQRKSRGRWDLWTIRPDGRAARAVTHTRSRDETDVAWAPDGRRLVFSSDAEGIELANLFVIGADGRNKRRVTRSRTRYDGAPTWSPDGKTIAFESRAGEPDGSAGTTLWTIAAPR